uniref:ATP synthase F0 subunit 8 n=1 Tax=Selenops bursarius TaxID=881841 RepID=A0A0U1X9V9_9ARAC|nr:ATP synthase F0 subunit 8 [Selenops bursarius]AIM52655.1 ATP synthase F0 subunit 8 [Selenops bursarius]
MPQLMPLFWEFSFFMMIFIVMMLIDLFCCSEEGFEGLDLMSDVSMMKYEW